MRTKKTRPWYMDHTIIKSSDDLFARMSAECRAAWEAHEAQYLGGYGGGRCTAARAFIAGWESARVGKALTLSEEFERLLEGDPRYGTTRGGSGKADAPGAHHYLHIYPTKGGYTATANQVGHSKPRVTPEDAVHAAIDCAVDLARRHKG